MTCGGRGARGRKTEPGGSRPESLSQGAPSTLHEPRVGGQKPAGPFLFTVVGKVLFLVFVVLFSVWLFAF